MKFRTVLSTLFHWEVYLWLYQTLPVIKRLGNKAGDFASGHNPSTHVDKWAINTIGNTQQTKHNFWLHNAKVNGREILNSGTLCKKDWQFYYGTFSFPVTTVEPHVQEHYDTMIPNANLIIFDSSGSGGLTLCSQKHPR